MRVWDYDQPPTRRAGDRPPRPISVKDLLAAFLSLATRGHVPAKSNIVETPRAARGPLEGGLRDRIAAAEASRGTRYVPGRAWGEWSPDAIAAIRARARERRVEMGGGSGGPPILPESEGCPYELRVLLRPGHPEGGAESRWYRSDLVALRAFTTARALLSDPELGLGLELMRHDCLVYEWTEVPGSDWRSFDASVHRRRDCENASHSPDVFDRLARLYDRYCALGYREAGACSRVCAESCPGAHGDLMAAMMRAEAAEINQVADVELPPFSGGPGGEEAASPRVRWKSGSTRRRKGPGIIPRIKGPQRP